MIIEDGTGRGYKAKVTDEHQLLVRACVEQCQRHMSVTHGQAYNAMLGTHANPYRTVTATGGYIMYLKNDNADYDMVIGRITASTSAIITFVLEKNPTLGVLGNYNAVVPVNKNYTSGNVAEATCGAWNGVGDGITGITAGTVVGTWQLNGGPYKAYEDESVVLGVGDILALFAKNTGNVALNVHFYYNICL